MSKRLEMEKKMSQAKSYQIDKYEQQKQQEQKGIDIFVYCCAPTNNIIM